MHCSESKGFIKHNVIKLSIIPVICSSTGTNLVAKQARLALVLLHSLQVPLCTATQLCDTDILAEGKISFFLPARSLNSLDISICSHIHCNFHSAEYVNNMECQIFLVDFCKISNGQPPYVHR